MSNTEKIYRYKLDDGSKKYVCPNCGKKRFVRFKDSKTGKYLPEQFGRCDREVSCGYFMDPYSNGYVKQNDANWDPEQSRHSQLIRTDYVPFHKFNASLKSYKSNRFVKYLIDLFNLKTAKNLITKYHIGSSNHWKGATVFWQVDIAGRVRTGKVMLYDDTGRRVKRPYNHINWVHSLLFDDFNLNQCLFGEHQLTNDKTIPVAIVESEKTAIISDTYFPEFIWLAAGAKANLKPERCKSLMGRRVVLFPDLGAYDDWKQKADELSYFCDISISDLLEKNAGDEAHEEGYDLADYLIQYDIKEFG